MSNEIQFIWIFHGTGARFSGGAFSRLEDAEAWIAKNRLSGVLTQYPIDVGVYEWAIANGLFKPRKPHEYLPAFIGGFTAASQDHYHFEDGQPV